MLTLADISNNIYYLMNLYEYQAKEILIKYGLPVLNGKICSSISDAKLCIESTQGPWALKCQIHSGGRGKSGGICITSKPEDALSFSKKWFGNNLITCQTTEIGELVHHILIEQSVRIKQEFYLSITINRDTSQLICMVSAQGGVNIEEIAQNMPHAIHKIIIDPLIGIYPYQGRILACNLGLSGNKLNQFSDIIVRIVRMFLERDLTLIEINPLILTHDDSFFCLDAKINIDDNAIFRQKSWLHTFCTDIIQDVKKNDVSTEFHVNYIPLTKGNIGCMVNGAGLAMATMDLIKLFGGAPANFLDIGGDANKNDIISSLCMILKNPTVEAILINIFGGIVCCDLIADSIITTLFKYPQYRTTPITVRLIGNNSELGINRLLNSNYTNIIIINHLIHAIKKTISITNIKYGNSH